MFVIVRCSVPKLQHEIAAQCCDILFVESALAGNSSNRGSPKMIQSQLLPSPPSVAAKVKKRSFLPMGSRTRNAPLLRLICQR